MQHTSLFDQSGYYSTVIYSTKFLFNTELVYSHYLIFLQTSNMKCFIFAHCMFQCTHSKTCLHRPSERSAKGGIFCRTLSLFRVQNQYNKVKCYRLRCSLEQILRYSDLPSETCRIFKQFFLILSLWVITESFV